MCDGFEYDFERGDIRRYDQQTDTAFLQKAKARGGCVILTWSRNPLLKPALRREETLAYHSIMVKDSSARTSFTPSFRQMFKARALTKENDAVCFFAHHWLIRRHDFATRHLMNLHSQYVCVAGIILANAKSRRQLLEWAAKVGNNGAAFKPRAP